MKSIYINLLVLYNIIKIIRIKNGGAFLMKMIDVNNKYFLLSFRFNKRTPDDFGLVQSKNDTTIFINIDDNSQWVWQESYDFGWGNENGFMRLPELNFEQLWYLLNNSSIQDNIYGSAYIIEQKYPDKLFEVLTNIFEQNKLITDKTLKEVLKILKLDDARNRSEILGKSITEIEIDFKKWKDLSGKVKVIIEQA